MAITIPFDLAYEFEVNALAPDVFAVLSDVPVSASHFPKVHQLVDLGGQAYRWEMEKVGTAQMNIQITDKKKFTHLVLKISGKLEVPLPSLMKGIVTPIVVGENEKLVEKYIANLIKRFGGEH